MIPPTEIQAPNFVDLPWLDHGFGLRDSAHPPDIVTLKQIHSGIVRDAAEIRPGQEGDAILSIATGIRIGVKTADCVPILLVDAETRAVAAIHAGWRGTAANIVQAAINEMTTRWKTAPENLRAAIGPSIGVCCYEVGPEVARQFGTWMPKMQR
ncbi:MAG TPA: polyphenol oxidase family protein, partial [Bryobacteraceae bacterium]|nr:polyphenol oxidase family protein [Bryobacteraceae bacterium]